MIEISKKIDCCGCSACYNACPMKCIDMKYDEEGFRYPVVDKSKCIKCGKCKSVCPIIQKKENKFLEYQNKREIAYAVQNKENDIRIKSSSGGFFSILAKYIIKNNGCVAGARMTDELKVEHILVDNEEELESLYGSKYLQSNLNDIYSKIKKELNRNRLVLFTGTPCQTAALRAYLNKNYENLILVDIICHGVPSQKVWDEYLKWKSNTVGKNIKKINFRNKKNGWKKFNMQIQYEDLSNEYISHKNDLFFKAFLNNIILRPSCYDCNFKDYQRNTDFTLGDLWGIQEICPKMDDDKGTSLVLINSEKAMQIWSKIQDKISSKEIDKKLALKYNSAAIKSVKRHMNQKKFYRELQKKEFDKAVIDAMEFNIFQKIYLKVLRKLKK